MQKMRLMSEYAAAVPLWLDDGLADSGSLPLSHGLQGDLESWSAVFQRHYDPLAGWDDRKIAQQHRNDGHRLLGRLRDELSGLYLIEADFWEHEDPGDKNLERTGNRY